MVKCPFSYPEVTYSCLAAGPTVCLAGGKYKGGSTSQKQVLSYICDCQQLKGAPPIAPPKHDLVVVTMEQTLPYSFKLEWTVKGPICDAVVN